MALSRLLAAAAAALALGLASGCADGSAPSDAAAPAEDATLGSLVTETSELANPRGAISWLDDFTCDADRKGRWTASGTVVNAGDETVVLRLRVAVVVRETGRVVAREVEATALNPGEERTFSHEHFHTSSATKVWQLDCVPRIVTGDASLP